MRISTPSITSLERRYVAEAMAQSDIGQGPFIEMFEQSWAEYNHRQFGVSCTSGTTALYLALKALGIGPGHTVAVPQFTMVACAWAVSYTGATPVFCDCGDDLLMKDFTVTRSLRAVMPVAIYGRPVSEDVYVKARAHGIPIVEDLAEGHGLAPRGDVTCYSFYGSKILTTGEGGMCLTNTSWIAEEMRLLRNMYFDKERSMIHEKIANNFRMTNLQAAVGVGQVQRAMEIIEKRLQVQAWYEEGLPERMRMPTRPTVWVMDVDCGSEVGQVAVKEALHQSGIESRLFFKPMGEQPYYAKTRNELEKLNAFKWSRRGLYLPCWADMTKADVMEVCATIQDVVNP